MRFLFLGNPLYNCCPDARRGATPWDMGRAEMRGRRMIRNTTKSCVCCPPEAYISRPPVGRRRIDAQKPQAARRAAGVHPLYADGQDTMPAPTVGRGGGASGPTAPGRKMHSAPGRDCLCRRGAVASSGRGLHPARGAGRARAHAPPAISARAQRAVWRNTPGCVSGLGGHRSGCTLGVRA